MDQDEDNLWPTEPKMIVGWPYNEFTFDGNVFFSNLVGELTNHVFQLGPNRKQKLQTKIIILFSRRKERFSRKDEIKRTNETCKQYCIKFVKILTKKGTNAIQK